MTVEEDFCDSVPDAISDALTARRGHSGVEQSTSRPGTHVASMIVT